MRRMHPLLLAALGAAAALLIIAVQIQRLSAARQRHEGALATLAQLERDAGEVMQLRARREVIAWRQRPTTDVLALVNAALIEAGIPTNRLQGIGEGADTPLGNSAADAPALRRQSMAVSLEGLTPSQIGMLLEKWQLAQDQWTAERLELTHRRDAKQADLYDLRLHISAVYLAAS